MGRHEAPRGHSVPREHRVGGRAGTHQPYSLVLLAGFWQTLPSEQSALPFATAQGKSPVNLSGRHHSPCSAMAVAGVWPAATWTSAANDPSVSSIG